MHSNNSGSHLRSMSASDVNLLKPKRNSTVASQTENFPNYGQLCNLREMSVQEIKDQYLKTLNFLNDCHAYMNEIFTGRFNSSKIIKQFEFRVPEVPNYFSLLEMFLERNKVENIGEVQEMRTKRDFFKDQKWFFDLRIAPDNGDGLEKTIANKQQAQFPINLKSLSTAFEEIYKTCNNFESKSEVILNTKHKPSIKFKPQQEKRKFNPEQGDQALQQESAVEMEPDESSMESRLSFTESVESFIESDQSLSDFINSESLSNSDEQQSLSENLNSIKQADEAIVDDSDCEEILDRIQLGNESQPESSRSSTTTTTATEMNQRKSYPFTLSNRDRCRDDIKEIITAMGLYTETGDIRPNIIKLLDKETASRATLSEKSVNFRTKRQPDIQVHYNNRNMRMASEEDLLIPSEENLTNLCVSTSTSSSTIVSESEVINIPNKQKRHN